MNKDSFEQTENSRKCSGDNFWLIWNRILRKLCRFSSFLETLILRSIKTCFFTDRGQIKIQFKVTAVSIEYIRCNWSEFYNIAGNNAGYRSEIQENVRQKREWKNFDPVSSWPYLYFMFRPIMMFRSIYEQTEQDHRYGLFSDKIIASTCIISRLDRTIARLFGEIYPMIVIFK